ncbi:MAG: hypothetical protein WDK96_00550 [Candidatus Paceibacterota bacterium]|jgi:hypothetical protein
MGKMKTVFIAHTISGDIEANIKKVIQICKQLHLSGKIIPIFPSFVWRQYLGKDEISKNLAKKVAIEYFRRGMVDELWLYGRILSDGMKEEIILALKYGIKVVVKNNAIRKDFTDFLATQSPV